MPQPSSSHHPLGDTCRRCTIHRLCSHRKKKKKIWRIASALIQHIRSISSEVIWFEHTYRARRNERSFIFGQICRNRQSPWCAVLSVISIKLQHQSTYWRSVLLSSVRHFVSVGRMGLLQLLLVTVLVIINIWGCDDSLRWEASCSVGVCCQIIPVVGIDY